MFQEGKVALRNSAFAEGKIYTPLSEAKEIHKFNVEFEKPFKNIPIVTCTPNYSGLQYIRPLTFAIYNVTTNGFEIYVCSENTNSDGVSLEFSWIAKER